MSTNHLDIIEKHILPNVMAGVYGEWAGMKFSFHLRGTSGFKTGIKVLT